MSTSAETIPLSSPVIIYRAIITFANGDVLDSNNLIRVLNALRAYGENPIKDEIPPPDGFSRLGYHSIELDVQVAGLRSIWRHCPNELVTDWHWKTFNLPRIEGEQTYSFALKKEDFAPHFSLTRFGWESWFLLFRKIAISDIFTSLKYDSMGYLGGTDWEERAIFHLRRDPSYLAIGTVAALLHDTRLAELSDCFNRWSGRGNPNVSYIHGAPIY